MVQIVILGVWWINVLHVQEVTTDPLDAYCKDVPEADECRVYEE